LLWHDTIQLKLVYNHCTMKRTHLEVIPGPGVLDDKKQILHRAGLVAPFVDWVQLDIADNKLVSNKTFLEPSGLEDIMQLPLEYELHMMTEDPASLITPWVELGFKRIIWHIEAFPDQASRLKMLEDIKLLQDKNIEVGLAVDKDTPVDVLFPYLDKIDCVLVMTIKAGFSGQSFIPELLDKVKAVKARIPDLPIEVDGGINFDTAALSVAAGVTRVVSTSTLYNATNIGDAILKMKNS
jgi:ribulose-phosphate 3-epimerase